MAGSYRNVPKAFTITNRYGCLFTGKSQEAHSLLWGGMASGGLGAAAPIMAFSLVFLD